MKPSRLTPSRFTHLTLAFGLGALAAVPGILASCADNEGGADPGQPDAQSLPEASADAAEAGLPDGSCDPSDPNCVTTPLTCEEADWCPVRTNVSTFYIFTNVWGSGKNDVWVTGSGATVIHWDGTTWTPTPVPSKTPVPLKETFRALWGTGPTDVWIASASDMIFHSDGFKDGAAKWELTPSATNTGFDRTPLFAAWGTTPENIRFGGGSSSWDNNGNYDNANQIVRKQGVPGIEWQRASGLATIHGLWGSSPENLWAIADNRPFFPQVPSMTLHGTPGDGGIVWTPVDSRATVVFRGIWGSSADDIWAVGDNGTIRHFGPGATEWSVIKSPTGNDLRGVWGSSPTDVWVVGQSGTILHYDGTEWKPSTAAFPPHRTKPNLNGVWGSGPNDVWIVGDDVALHYTGGAK